MEKANFHLLTDWSGNALLSMEMTNGKHPYKMKKVTQMNIISHKLCSLGNSIALKKIQPCVLVTILVGLFILLRHTNINLKRKVQTCMVSG